MAWKNGYQDAWGLNDYLNQQNVGGWYDTSGSVKRGLAAKEEALRNRAWENWLNASNPGTQEVPDPTLVSQTKNQQIADALKGTVSAVGGLSTNPNVKQGALQSYTKSAPIQSAIDKALSQWNLDSSNSAQSVADFAKNWMASQGRAEANANEEAGQIGRIWSGDLENRMAGVRSRLSSDLAAVRNAEKIGNIQALQRRLGSVALTAKLGDLAGGTDSYISKLALDAAQKASITNDLALAEQQRKDILGLAGMEREDIGTLLNAQLKTAGLRQTLLDNVIKRGLVPAEVANQFSTQDLQRLAAITNMTGQNTFYDFQSAPDLVAKKLAALGAATNISNANTIFGLKQPSVPDTRGYLPVGWEPYVRNPRLPVAAPMATPDYSLPDDWGMEPELPATAKAITRARASVPDSVIEDYKRTPEYLQDMADAGFGANPFADIVAANASTAAAAPVATTPVIAPRAATGWGDYVKAAALAGINPLAGTVNAFRRFF